MVGDQVIFRVRNRKKKYGLLLLHPLIGNYTSVKHPQFEYSAGDVLDFYCPLCSHSLSTDIDERLAFVMMIDADGKEHDIYFSRISGEHSTFQVTEDTVTATGEHSEKYTYFKVTDRFKQFLKR
jgi:hypothetical protein